MRNKYLKLQGYQYYGFWLKLYNFSEIFTEIISGSTNSRKYFELINELKGRVLMRLRKGGLNIINIKERVANRLGVLCKSVINVNELDFQVRFQSSKNQL